MRNIFKYLLYLIFIFPNLVWGNETLILRDSTYEYTFTNFTYSLLEDTEGKLTIDDILSGKYAFQISTNTFPTADNPQHSYWMKMEILDSSSARSHWIMELHNNRIDYVAFYALENGHLLKEVSGENYPFKVKNILHKNYHFKIPDSRGEKITIYINIKTSDKAGFYGMIRKFEDFTSYALSEYMHLGVFYGFLISVLLYNLFIFFYLKSAEYFYYFLYVLSFGIYSASFDGTGFQFLWSEYPEINNFVPPAAFCGVIIFELLFAKSFNDIPSRFPKLNKVLIAVIVLRILYLILSITLLPELSNSKFIDLIPILMLLLVGIYSYKEGYKLSRFYIVGVSFFLTGFVLNLLMSYNIIYPTILTVYALNFSIILEIIAFSICLADRFRNLKTQNDSAEKNIIIKNKEIESIEKNKEVLERAVRIRTAEIHKQQDQLQRKNEDLDTFLYKSSHNLRGPIKSIEGLCNLLITETDPGKKKQYINLILETSYTLDRDLLNLRLISELNKKKLENTSIDIGKTIEDLKQKESSLINIIVNCTENYTLKADETLFVDFLKNILKSAIKLNAEKDAKAVTINSALHSNEVHIDIIIKNPIQTGISDAELFKPFNIDLKFASQIDFELYRSKLIVEKMNGMLMKEKSESTVLIFKIVIPNLP